MELRDEELVERLRAVASRNAKGFFDPRTIAADVLAASQRISQLAEQLEEAEARLANHDRN